MKRIALFLLIVLCTGCSGALTPTITPTIPITVVAAPTPLPNPTSPSCNNVPRSEQVARVFIASYNTGNGDAILGQLSDNMRGYFDGGQNFSAKTQIKVALRTYLPLQFKRKDKFEITDVKAQVDPGYQPPYYAVTITGSRSVEGATQNVSIQMGVECATGQIILIAIIPN